MSVERPSGVQSDPRSTLGRRRSFKNRFRLRKFPRFGTNMFIFILLTCSNMAWTILLTRYDIHFKIWKLHMGFSVNFSDGRKWERLQPHHSVWKWWKTQVSLFLPWRAKFLGGRVFVLHRLEDRRRRLWGKSPIIIFDWLR